MKYLLLLIVITFIFLCGCSNKLYELENISEIGEQLTPYSSDGIIYTESNDNNMVIIFETNDGCYNVKKNNIALEILLNNLRQTINVYFLMDLENNQIIIYNYFIIPNIKEKFELPKEEIKKKIKESDYIC